MGQEYGHYTQVVWATTTEVGCGYVFYGPENEMLLICNYKIAGNMVKGSMYKKGPACSACPSNFGHCDDGLCAPSAFFYSFFE